MPWLLVLLPILAVHLSYALAASNADVPWCNPYIDGCTSISRAARNGTANIVFKSLMLPYAALLAVFWKQLSAWLLAQRPDANRRCCSVRILGITAAVFLAIYAVFLGIDGEFYQWMRRYGITVFFGFSVLAQMLTLALLTPLADLGSRLRNSMLCFSALLLVLGLLSLPLKHFSADAKAAMNALEWTYAGLMTLFYALIGMTFRVNGLNIPQR
ncbi:MAG: hypothetical protein M3O62_18715 [Pseudomonadota bacterium]|nr:hypothetical protein [Pseudomonadota bacterium]